MKNDAIKIVLWDYGGVLTESPIKNFQKFENDNNYILNTIVKINSNNKYENAWAKFEKDEIYVAYMEDGINGERHCAFPIVSRVWYNCLGRFTPGIFNFGYNDTFIFEVGQMLNRTHFMPHIRAEHLHFSKGAPMDDTYARNRTQEKGNLYAKDKLIFDKTRAVRQKDRDMLREIIGMGQATKLKPKIPKHKYQKHLA